MASSNVVEHNGVIFETLVPERILPIPENTSGAETPVKFGIRIENQIQKPLRFCSHLASPILIGVDGKRLRSEDCNERRINPLVSDCPMVFSRYHITFFISGRLIWEKNELQLEGYREYRERWLFRNINLGSYGFRFRYVNPKDWKRIKPSEIFWTEGVETPLIEISFVLPQA